MVELARPKSPSLSGFLYDFRITFNVKVVQVISLFIQDKKKI